MANVYLDKKSGFFYYRFTIKGKQYRGTTGKKTQKQVNRYTEVYGQGAIIYRHGFCDGLHLRGAQKLDAMPVDLSRLIEHNESRS